LNSKEYGYPFSKKGILRGYIKYGVFAYIGWHYFKLAITPSSHHGHDSHGAHATATEGAAGDHGHSEKKHH
jgi:hypothetical protein